MPARSTRQEARARLRTLFEASLDRMFPEDESMPLQGTTFNDFEEMAIENGDPITTAMMEERAALDDYAKVEGPERCPRCASDRVYRRAESSNKEYQSTRGTLVLEEQRFRCRACNVSFSPQKKDGVSP